MLWHQITVLVEVNAVSRNLIQPFHILMFSFLPFIHLNKDWDCLFVLRDELATPRYVWQDKWSLLDLCLITSLSRVGYRWITRLLALALYAMFLMPGFIQGKFQYLYDSLNLGFLHMFDVAVPFSHFSVL